MITVVLVVVLVVLTAAAIVTFTFGTGRNRPTEITPDTLRHDDRARRARDDGTATG